MRLGCLPYLAWLTNPGTPKASQQQQSAQQQQEQMRPRALLNNPQDKVISTQEHCVFCFDVLTSYLNGDAAPTFVLGDALCPLFVTWNIASSIGHHGWRLRGCIGTLEPRQLSTALKDYALTSALRDSRFSPVVLREVPQLKCTVSLLSCFEQAADWKDWQIGIHGIIIEFTDPLEGIRRSATFLPEVAKEQGWDHVETLDALVRKSGCSAQANDKLLSSISVVRYQSTIATVTYAEYAAMKEAM